MSLMIMNNIKKSSEKCDSCKVFKKREIVISGQTLDNNRYIIRLKKIEGQIRGLQKMLEEDRYCIDIITQTSAVRNALRSFEDVILKDHLETCVVHQMKNDKEKQAVEEILKVYKLKK